MDDDLRSVTTSSVTSQSLFQRVQLDSMERDWFRFAALGNAAALGQLLKQDPTLASKKHISLMDIQCVFWEKKTARHWAAKHGRLEMAEMIAKAGVGVSIKSLRAACYTPQNIAAFHSHSHIIQLLVGTYNAKANMRDYNGKMPKHYWKGSVDVFSTPSLDSCGRWAREEKRSHRYGHFPSILQNPRSWSQDRLWAEYMSSPELAVIKKGQARSPSCTRN